jgi:hypothetical protein
VRARTSILTVMISVVLGAAACSGIATSLSGLDARDEATGALVSASVSQASGPAELIYCKPFDEASRSATIGILGGVIKVGPHSLVIPPGALLSPRTITARIPKNDYSHSVLLSPEGLQFKVPALLTLSYSGCDRQTLLRQLKVVYASDNLSRILELLPSINNPLQKATTGTITHFSRYAVAY